MKASIPVLTSEIPELSGPDSSFPPSAAKIRNIFFTVFFIAETKIQRLADLGFTVHRRINDNSPFSVTYKFDMYTSPFSDTQYVFDNITIVESDPFAERDSLYNVLNTLLSAAAKDRQIRDAKALIEASLTPAQREALKVLSAQDLKKALE